MSLIDWVVTATLVSVVIVLGNALFNKPSVPDMIPEWDTGDVMCLKGSPVKLYVINTLRCNDKHCIYSIATETGAVKSYSSDYLWRCPDE